MPDFRLPDNFPGSSKGGPVMPGTFNIPAANDGSKSSDSPSDVESVPTPADAELGQRIKAAGGSNLPPNPPPLDDWGPPVRTPVAPGVPTVTSGKSESPANTRAAATVSSELLPKYDFRSPGTGQKTLYRVKLKDGFNTVPAYVVAADDRWDAQNTYKKWCGIIMTPHDFDIDELGAEPLRPKPQAPVV